jgi:AcrR family transcriptional regulator
LIEARKAGRPRDPDVDAAIFRATAELLGEGGYANLTIEGVAQRAGVTRGSIYRRWTSKLVLVTALMREVSGSAPLPDTGSLRGDLIALYRLYARNLSTSGGPIVPSLVAEAMHNPELASIMIDYVDERRA